MRLGHLGPKFRKVWAASAVSLAGDGLILSAMPLLLASLTPRAELIAGLEVARGLPWLLFGLLGGVVADRADRRRVMAIVDFGRAVAVAALALAVLRNNATVGLVWTVAFVLGAGEVFFDNSAQSILPSLVKSELIERANSRFFITEAIARDLAGPAAGAAIFASVASLPFTIDAFSFLGAALIVSTLRGSFHAKGRSARRRRSTIRADLREGARWLRNHELLRALVVIGCTYNFLVVGAEAVNVLFVLRVLHASKATYGLVLTTAAIGGLAAAASAERVIKKLGPGRTILTTLAVAGVAGLVAGTTRFVAVFALGIAAAVACGTLANIVVLSLRQTLVPDDLLGRVNSFYRVSIATAAPLGALVFGALAEHVSLRAPLVTMGIGALLLTVAAAPVVNNRAVERARIPLG